MLPTSKLRVQNIFSFCPEKYRFLKVAELKEVFMLFDRDEDGVLSIQELQVAIKSKYFSF